MINNVVIFRPFLTASLLFLIGMSPICRADFGLHMYQGDSFRSGAGKTSTADNAAVAFNNPAALTHLSARSFLFEGTYYATSIAYTDNGSTDVIGAPLSGSNGGDAGTNQLVPGLFYADKLNSRWSYGVALNAPFGLSVEWPDTWIGRYHVIKTGIETININPALAYKINNNVSIGFGISAQKATAELSNAIDYGAVCFQVAGPVFCSGVGLTPQSADGKVTVKGDDWGYGYNLGLFIDAGASHIGLSYRSKIDYQLKGTADFTNPPQAAAFLPAFTDTNATVPLTLPEVFSLGLTQDLSAALRLSLDATWTRWSRIKSFDFTFENPAQPGLTINRNWKDTWRYALGLEYKKDSRWTFQGGIAYADSAIPDSTLDPAIPIANAWWFSAGVIYSYSQTFNIGAGLNHIKFVDRTMNNTGPYGDTLRGTLSPKLNVYTVQLIWNI